MVELNDVEKLIVEQAFLNAVAKDTRTKTPDNLRGRVDAMMEDAYYNNPMAGRSFDLKLFGEKVGTYSMTVSKGKPQQTDMTLEISDRDGFMAWAEENGYIERVADMEAILADFKEHGVIPEGCTPVEVITPEVVGGVVTRTTVKVDQERVARVLGPQLEPVVYALLGGGEDEQ